MSGSEVTGGEQEPDDYTESLFPLTEDSGPRYVESSLLRGQGDTREDHVNFGEWHKHKVESDQVLTGA